MMKKNDFTLNTVTYSSETFSLPQIAESGQCFRMETAGGGPYEILAPDRYLRARQEGNTCVFFCSPQEFESFWRPYFDVDTDYAQWIRRIDPADAYLTRAAEAGKGIRILRQNPFEMIITFLISQQNNIRRIKRCIRSLCLRYGKPMRAPDGTGYYAFPTPEALAAADTESLLECNLGYRSKYVLAAAQSVRDGMLAPEMLVRAGFREARAELLKLYGVGPKVADCICLFGLHQLEAFPVDTHIRQALEKHYPEGFPFEKYSGFQGVLQQFIFYRELFPAGEQK